MKGLLIATLLGGIACGVFAFLLGMKHTETKETLAATEVELTSTKKQRDAAKAAQTAAEEAQKVAETQLAEANAKVTQLESDLTAAKAEATKLQTALADSEAAKNDALAQLKEIQQKVGEGEDPEQLARQIESQNEKITALTQEKQVLEESLKDKDKQIEEIELALQRSKEGDLPPGIRGRVAKVNQDWNFVVLNIGYREGVVPNGELVVYRGNQMIGRVKVTSASPDTSVANILPEWQKSQIRPGDKVFNGTKVVTDEKGDVKVKATL